MGGSDLDEVSAYADRASAVHPTIIGEAVYTISLWQPWASFIAIGIKRFETRHWSPPRGLIGQRIAIHAAKKPVSIDDRSWADQHGIRDLPLGAIVCTAILAGAYQCGRYCRDKDGHGCAVISSMRSGSRDNNITWLTAGIPIDDLGDYSPGRWAWWLTDIERFDPAIPAKGAQGFWKWQRDTRAAA